MLLKAVICLIFFLASCSNHTEGIAELSDWEYFWPTSIDETQDFRQSLNQSNWTPIQYPSNPPDRSGRNLLFLRASCKPNNQTEASLYIPRLDQIFEIYYENQIIYQFGSINAKGSGQYIGTPWHLFRLPKCIKGNKLHFIIYSNYSTIGLPDKAYTGSEYRLLLLYLYSKMGILLLSFLLLILSIASILIYAMEQNYKNALYLSIFTMAASGFYFSQSGIWKLFADFPFQWMTLQTSFVFILQPSFLSFFSHSFDLKFRSMMKLLIQINTLYFLVSLLLLNLHFIEIYIAIYLFIVSVFGNLIFLSIIIAQNKILSDKEFRVLLTTFILLLIFTLIEIINELGIEGERFISYIGFFIFTCGVIWTFSIKIKNIYYERNLAKEALVGKNQVLTVVSHEIRTPLNGIHGAIDLLENTKVSESQYKYLEIMRGCCDLLLTIVNDILDYSKLDTGKLILDSVPFNLHDKVNEAIDLFAIQAKNKNIIFHFEIGQSVPEMIVGSPSRIKQIIINLISNAIKFTEEGSITISIDETERKDGISNILFSVKDTGIGIPQNKLKNLFQLFYQVSTDRTRRYGGTGLGLAITKRIVELMGGNITVSSEEFKGTKFSILLPLTIYEKKEENFTHDEEEIHCKLRILITDDNEINRLVLMNMLAILGCSIIEATSGEEAIALIANNQFDLVFMDIEMPELSGIDTVKILKDKNITLPKIIALTAHAGEDIQDKLVGLMDGYLHKPVSLNEIKKTVIQYCENFKICPHRDCLKIDDSSAKK